MDLHHEILDDGTIQTTIGGLVEEEHAPVEELLAIIAELTGGGTRVRFQALLPLDHAQDVAVQPVRRPPRRAENSPRVPDVATLPRVPRGREHAGEWIMNVDQFAGWCGVAEKTVRDWLMKGQVARYEKRGAKKQSRIRIASGERERRLHRVHGKRFQAR